MNRSYKNQQTIKNTTQRKSLTNHLLFGILATCGWATLQGQQDSTERVQDVYELESYVVQGIKESLISAQEIKQNRYEIVDSIVADDIKLPDINVTDALQRISGIQVQKDRGEGSRVVVRGLQQTANTINGREVFTAGLGYTGAPSRMIDFAGIPSEMAAGLNVYKTASADQLEGGIGGLIEIVTRKPFDFEGSEAVVSARLIDGNLIDKVHSQYSALFSNQWELDSGGKFGALINFTYQDRGWREERAATGAPKSRTDIIAGKTVNLQDSITMDTSFGNRERIGVSGVLQWQVNDQVQLYAEGNYTKLDTFQDTHQLVLIGDTPVGGSAQLAAGTNDVEKITWQDGRMSILSFARDTQDWTKQYAVGAIFTGEKLTLKADLSYTDSYDNLYFAGPFFAGTHSGYKMDNSTAVPSNTIVATDLTDPANWKYTSIAYRERPYYGDQTAFAIDGTYNLGSGFLHTLQFGARTADRHVDNGNGLIFDDKPFASDTAPSATQWPNLVRAGNPYGLFPGESTPVQRDFMTGVVDEARDIQPFLANFGITTPVKTSADQYSLYSVDETTNALYAMSKFKAGDLPLTGNFGLRFVETKENVNGYLRNRLTDGSTVVEPLNIKTDYTNTLPSLNLRYKLPENVVLRVSASKTLTRPDFNQLSPSLTLVPHPIQPELNQGSGGNPNLNPIKSKNIDLAIEKYFGDGNNIYATFFQKDVDGFIVSSGSTEIIDGAPYLITRPMNSDAATIKGFEVGYTQFFPELPGVLSGLGLQANYTFIDSETPNSVLGDKTQLPNLSENSYNIIAMYEKDKLSARLAYNWRDEFLSGQANIAGIGRIPYLTGAYGWVDASITYDANEHLSISLEGSNLSKSKRISYYGSPTLPQVAYVNDRQISVYTSYRF